MLNEVSPEVGSGTCVGMVGATLGGGIGRLQGLHGLIIDALVSVEFVTAAGDLITVSKTENSDLFWALRGTGANFGIVISATYEVYPASNGGRYLNSDFIFPASSNLTHWEILKSFDTTLPAGMSLTTSVAFDATSGGVSGLSFAMPF
jgi:FAD/FMN-containing dehydrogenase